MPAYIIHLSDSLYTTKYFYDVNLRVQYVAEAAPGTAVSSPNWRIKKYVYNTDGNVTDTLFASGTTQFDKVCDDREKYDYS